MEEIWKDIPNLPGYQASNLGQIRSVDRWMQRKIDKNPFLKKGKILTPLDNGNGYLGVNIKGTRYYIHRLVLSTFCPDHTQEQTDVNHKDGNKSNNCLDNLEWCTKTENNFHAYNTGLHSSGEKHPQSKYSNDLICFIKEEYQKGKKVGEISKELGIAHQYISGILSGKKRRHG